MGFKRGGLDDRVKLVSITHGADFEFDLSRFEEREPRFAYVDDLGGGVGALNGLTLGGRIVIPQRPDFMWLRGPRDCVVLRALPQLDRASFRAGPAGEFCVELYHLRPNGEAVLIHQNDFCFK